MQCELVVPSVTIGEINEIKCNAVPDTLYDVQDILHNMSNYFSVLANTEH